MVCILTKSLIVPPTAPGNGHNIAECCNYDFPKWKWIFGCNGELKSRTTSGRDVQVIHNDRSGKKVTRLVKKAFYACPSDDYFGISVDITVRWGLGDVGPVHWHCRTRSSLRFYNSNFFRSVCAWKPSICMASMARSDAWKRLGVHSSWVRAKELIKFERLRKVVVILRGQLPVSALPWEWRTWKVK